MSALVFAAPYRIPPPPIAPRTGYSQIWHGCDGSIWDLNDIGGGVILTNGGTLGMHLPDFDRQTSSSAASAGTRLRGTRTKERAVDWGLFIWSDDESQEWRDRDTAFWRSLDEEKTGTWEIRGPSEVRYLDLTLASGGDHAYDIDPAFAGWALYTPALVADAPYWYGDVLGDSWERPQPVPFFGGLEGDGNLWVSSSASWVEATLTNPGDADAWTRWTLEGPLTSVSITIDGGMFTCPSVAAGKTLIIDTDPTVGTALLNGVDISGQIDPWDPHELPKGADVPITIDAEGFGTVSVEFTPLYKRAI